MNRILLSIISVFLVLATSCVQENAGSEQLESKLPPLAEQVASMKLSLDDIRAVSDIVDLGEYSAAVNEHIDAVDAGMPLAEASVNALSLQARLADVIGSLSEDIFVTPSVSSLSEGMSLWLGSDFRYYYAVRLQVSKLGRVISQLQRQNEEILLLDSDTGSLATSIASDSDLAFSLNDELLVLGEEILEGYKSIIISAESDLDALNAKASAVLKATSAALSEILVRIQQCENEINQIKDRLDKIEGDIDELLGMIQSLTFVSENSSQSATAYYTLSSAVDENRASEGKKARVPEGDLTLNYLVRPASAAASLAEQTLWNDGVKVIGYEAPKVQLKAVPALKDFEIVGVRADAQSGLLTVSVRNDFSDSFYFKEQGAKLALSITSGKSDLTSQFIEVLPKDKSGKIYAESLNINTSNLSLQNGANSQLNATVTPADVTDKGFVWESLNTDVVTVDQSGRITAVGLGEAAVKVKSNATDEWGRYLTAQCTVTVTAGIRVKGPSYVEVGTTVELDIESPSHIDAGSIDWSIAGNGGNYAELVVDNGKARITGKAMSFDSSQRTYSSISVKCQITGEAELEHNICVVARQPKSIVIEGLAYNQNQITLKRESIHTLVASLDPSDVDMSCFRIKYQSTAANIASVNFDTGVVTALAPGTAFIDVKVLDSGSNNYFYPSRNEMVRQVAVRVEPYWVTSVSLPERVTLPINPDNETTLSPSFTSDVDGKQPDDVTLTWTSSDPSVVSINEKTGAMVALKEGTATITATTAGTWSVPSGQAPKSASCLVKVEEAGAPVYVGDFYYSDGTWSTQLDKSKTVIGVVFATVSAATADKNMMKDYPECTHGLVLGLTEYSSAFGGFGYSSVYNWLLDNGYETPNTSKPNGYGLTKGLAAYRAANSSYAELFDKNSGPAAKHKVSSPASSWYIPSYYEMKQIYENMSVINASLSKVSASQIAQTYYWSSTFRTYGSNDCQAAPFNMAAGDWYPYDKKTTVYPVRVVLAF